MEEWGRRLGIEWGCKIAAVGEKEEKWRSEKTSQKRDTAVRGQEIIFTKIDFLY